MNEDAPAAGLKSREIAIALLSRLSTGEVTLDDALRADDAFAALDARDRAFVRLLVATTLRRRGQIDALLKTYLRRPLPRRANAVRRILQLAVAQLLFLKSPPHAVVDIAVRMCRRFPGQKGLVNAVLRRIAEDGAARLSEIDPKLNTPKWLWESWSTAYGEESSRRIAAAHMAEPPLDLTVKADPETWAKDLGGTALYGNTIRLSSGGEVAALPGYADGAWWVQDIAATLPARMLLDLLPDGGDGARIIDLCAAPGGKTAQLAAAGARVTAVDRSKPRMGILQQNLARLGLQAETVTADALRWRPNGRADAVLLDAPCSATGTIRRHPDLPFAKKETDVARMAGLQLKLAQAALAMLKPGGILVYSVCSLQTREGEEIIGKLIAGTDDAQPVPLPSPGFGRAVALDGGGAGFRTLPADMIEQGGMDGFFVAALRRG